MSGTRGPTERSLSGSVFPGKGTTVGTLKGTTVGLVSDDSRNTACVPTNGDGGQPMEMADTVGQADNVQPMEMEEMSPPESMSSNTGVPCVEGLPVTTKQRTQEEW